ncbi:MAG: hypothetical protein JXA03_13570 [Bacteroidales bacterium]|nr:hypothetical protein [Bacteroidales bacterium]
MWELFLHRQGFRNVIRGGQTTGFQFKIHLPYYRGLWVSASFRGFAVRVDGVHYPNDKITIKIGNKTYRFADVDQAYEDFWYYGDLATIIVEKPGGLTDGLHKVECGISYENSYGTYETPPAGYEFAYAGGFGTGFATSSQAKTSTDPMAGLRSCSLDMVLVI